MLHGCTESPIRVDDDGDPSTTRYGRAALGPGLLSTALARSVWRSPWRISADSERRAGESRYEVTVRSEWLCLSVSTWASQKTDVGAGAGPGWASGGTAGAAGDWSGKSECSIKPGSCAAAAVAAEMPREQVCDGEGQAPVGQTELLILFL